MSNEKTSVKAIMAAIKSHPNLKGVTWTKERDPESVARDRAIAEGMRRAKEPEGKSPTPFRVRDR